MKTLHYYLVAISVTAIFFALMVLVSGKQNISSQASAPAYTSNAMHNANDQTDPVSKAIATQRAKHKDANLADAGSAKLLNDSDQK